MLCIRIKQVEMQPAGANISYSINLGFAFTQVRLRISMQI